MMESFVKYIYINNSWLLKGALCLLCFGLFIKKGREPLAMFNTVFGYPLLLWLINKIAKWMSDPETRSMQTSPYSPAGLSGHQWELLEAGGLINIRLTAKQH